MKDTDPEEELTKLRGHGVSHADTIGKRCFAESPESLNRNFKVYDIIITIVLNISRQSAWRHHRWGGVDACIPEIVDKATTLHQRV